MKKIIAVMLCLLIACMTFACLVSAEVEVVESSRDPYEGEIPQVVTNLIGQYSADHTDELHSGLTFLRALTEKMTKLAQDIARAFDQLAERLKGFRAENLLSNVRGIFQ